MISRSSTPRLAAMGAAVALALIPALAGCGSSARPAAARPAASAPLPEVTRAAPVLGGTIPKYTAANNARKSVVTGTCQPDGPRGWVFKGTATNTAKVSRGFTIVVDFVTTKGDTVLATRVVHLHPLAPKATVHWRATGATGQANVNCVVREALTAR